MIGFDKKLTQNLMRILIIIILGFLSLARAQQTPLVVTDVKKGNFKIQKSIFTYDDAYIINENYVVFQKDNTRKTFTVDGNSFRVYDDDFSLDKNGVYYQGKLIPTDTTGFKILIYKSIPKEGKDKYAYTLLPIWKTQQGVFIETKLIKDIDPFSVETIKNSYYLKDKKHLYYYDKLVAGAEVENLMEAFANDEIISDGKTVYYGGTPLHYQREKLTQVNRRIFKTPTKVLFFSNCYDNTFLELLPYFDIPTLKALNDSYLVDKNHIYKPVDYISVNKNTYLAVPNVKKELLNKIKFFPKGRFFSDTENIYFDGIIQKHYDAATFNILTDGENYYQYDKNGIYNFTYKLDFNYTEPVQLGKNTFFVKEKLVYLNQVFDFTLGGGSYYHSLTEEELEKIKQKYANDKQMLNIKTMELYREHKVNPLGGCLPILIQLPILFALFGVLRSGIIPTDSSFLWMKLSEPDPFFILPVLNGAVSFLQQKLMGTSDNAQMKNMMYVFPIMMIVISYKMPSGLQLYWLTSSLIAVIQQYFIMKKGA